MSHQLILKCHCGKTVSTMIVHPNEGQPDVDEIRTEGRCATCSAKKKHHFGSGGKYPSKSSSTINSEMIRYHGKPNL